tara:strand:- start:149 stop:487 length:339 start_codon:yes stop_codon:yes gene_type:complete
VVVVVEDALLMMVLLVEVALHLKPTKVVVEEVVQLRLHKVRLVLVIIQVGMVMVVAAIFPAVEAVLVLLGMLVVPEEVKMDMEVLESPILIQLEVLATIQVAEAAVVGIVVV